MSMSDGSVRGDTRHVADGNHTLPVNVMPLQYSGHAWPRKLSA